MSDSDQDTAIPKTVTRYRLLVASVVSPAAVTIFNLPFKHSWGIQHEPALDPLREISIEIFGRRRHIDLEAHKDRKPEPEAGRPNTVNRESIGLNHGTSPRARFYAIANPVLRHKLGIKFVEVKPSELKTEGFEALKLEKFPNWDTHSVNNEEEMYVSQSFELYIIRTVYLRLFAVWDQDVAELQNEKFLAYVESLPGGDDLST